MQSEIRGDGQLCLGRQAKRFSRILATNRCSHPVFPRSSRAKVGRPVMTTRGLRRCAKNRFNPSFHSCNRPGPGAPTEPVPQTAAPPPHGVHLPGMASLEKTRNDVPIAFAQSRSQGRIGVQREVFNLSEQTIDQALHIILCRVKTISRKSALPICLWIMGLGEYILLCVGSYSAPISQIMCCGNSPKRAVLSYRSLSVFLEKCESGFESSTSCGATYIWPMTIGLTQPRESIGSSSTCVALRYGSSCVENWLTNARFYFIAIDSASDFRIQRRWRGCLRVNTSHNQAFDR